MSRRRVIHRKTRAIDSRYGDTLIAGFIARMMWNGKKSVSERLLYRALDKIEQDTSEKPLEIFHKALSNVKPTVEVKSRRVGGATYQVPVEIDERRQVVLAMRWIIAAARQQKGKSMDLRLKDQILDAYHNTGSAIKKKEDIRRMAESNKAFAHYRW